MKNNLEIFTKDTQKYFEPSFDEINNHIKKLVPKLKDKKWKGIVTVTRGGLFPALSLSYHLNIKNIETVGLSSYTVEKQEKLKLVKDFNRALVGNGEGWLLIDDLSDTGKSIQFIKKMMPKAHIATVYVKPQGADLVDDYVHEIPQDVWIIFPWEENKELPNWHTRENSSNNPSTPKI